MSASPDPAMIDQAIAWHLRLQNADEDVWIEFTDWLNADPAHNEVYEAVVDGEADFAPLLEQASFPDSELVGGDEHEHSDREEVGRKNPWLWGALAASVAVAGFFGVQLVTNADTTYQVETVAGETRTVSLTDGSEIHLNGNTSIMLDESDMRLVELDRGEARFAVTHDENDPFTVVVGEQRLVDIGTVFNVVRTDSQLRVGVSEGEVRYEGPAETVDLRVGDTLTLTNGRIEVSQSPAAAIGSWTGGRLIYEQTPLRQVADDLFRSTGISLELPQEMRSRRFSGVIQTNGDQNALRERLEELIGGSIIADGTRWSVEDR
ncbi:FecR family protein [Aurantiacibacter flavus]|uniref:FecR domain-containing protein n=1 Tax=Aurantiacibacter flavus TaxID=3145232 RepID=A0ABV0D0X7_9SPHN